MNYPTTREAHALGVTKPTFADPTARLVWVDTCEAFQTAEDSGMSTPAYLDMMAAIIAECSARIANAASTLED